MPDLGMDASLRSEQTQEQKQSHRLIVSQKHQQAIELLQYPAQELSQWVNQQLQENPLLERDEFSEEEDEELPDELEDLTQDIDWDEYANREEDYRFKRTGGATGSAGESEETFRALARQHETLHDSLEWQLELLDIPPEDTELGRHLISYVNRDGLFEGDVGEIAGEWDRDPGDVESLLGTIQEFSPPGVAGRSLEEVLLIQLDQLEVDPPQAARPILENHLEDLQNRSFSKIARSLNIEETTVQRVADLVHDLEPRPGRIHEPENRQYVTPDVIIRELDDEYVILINDQAPPLTISRQYYSMLQSGDEETREYVKDKLRGALWIMQCIFQRHETLYRVTESILQQQKSFFNDGVQELKPLVLQDVAEDIGVHQSTVSRAVKDKYVQTNRGLFELSFFFSSGLETDGDAEPVSSTAIKDRIREMVENEDKTDPLNDREIKARLNEEGIQIGRRTVSKYREQLLISPWKLRKRVS